MPFLAFFYIGIGFGIGFGAPDATCCGGESGGLGCFDDDRVVSRCNPSTERDRDPIAERPLGPPQIC